MEVCMYVVQVYACVDVQENMSREYMRVPPKPRRSAYVTAPICAFVEMLACNYQPTWSGG